MIRKVELLSPAKDIAVGKAAIDNGADAIYIGAPAFGARKVAANSIRDIAELVDYAHRFYCRVFVTLNTILYDHELSEAEKMVRQLCAVGIDALIIQDMGILKMDLPPVCLHASTQMHNYEPERIKFLDRLGFQRIVLARELSIEQIRTIRREVKAELEVFIHGALCVSLSGQCYLSQYMFGRSANRGECAQPCRMKWSVKDSSGRVWLKDKYVLSLKDLNLSSHIGQLIEAGVDSFKIEGRLKDMGYVANVTNHYSSLINCLPDVSRVGSGHVSATFEPDPERSFNRGSSDYFSTGRKRGLVHMDTPKSMGKPIGQVKEAKGCHLFIDAAEQIFNGDGLCFLENGELKGIRVNKADGNHIECNEIPQVRPGTMIYRNYDHRFVAQLEKGRSVRKINIVISATMTGGHLYLKVTDEDGISASYVSDEKYEIARQETQRERLIQQLRKCGDTEFECEQVEVVGDEVLFIPGAAANACRRTLLEKLREARQIARPVLPTGMNSREEAIAPTYLDWHYNVANKQAEEFYQLHGALQVESAFEKKKEINGIEVMRTRYCLLYEMGRCRKECRNTDMKFPLFLCNDKHRFRLDFDCESCFMKVITV